MNTLKKHLLPAGLALLAVTSSPAQTATLYGVGDLAGGANYSEVRDVAKVGGVIYAVGGTSTINAGNNTDTPFLWTSTGGLTAIPQLVTSTTGSGATFASAITPDGVYIAGRSHFNATSNLREAVRVTTSGLTSTDLGGDWIAGKTNVATAISDDGSLVYGFAIDNSGNTVTVRYSGGIVTPIASLNGASNMTPIGEAGVSASGNVLVGTASTTGAFGLGANAFIYHNNNESVNPVPYLSGGTWNASLAVNSAGSMGLFGGDSTANPNGELFLYDGTITTLGSPNSAWGFSNGGGMTDDGSVVAAAFGGATTNNVSFIRNSNGWFNLDAAAIAAGADLTGWSDLNVYGISRDGTLLWGDGLHGGNWEGFVLEFSPGSLAAIPEPSMYAAVAGLGALGFAARRQRRRLNA